MSDFDERGRAFEKKFEMDEEAHFRVSARASKMVGSWAVQKIGLSGAEADAYIAKILDADLSKGHHDAVVSILEKDFQARSLNIPRQQIAEQFEICLKKAQEDLSK